MPTRQSLRKSRNRKIHNMERKKKRKTYKIFGGGIEDTKYVIDHTLSPFDFDKVINDTDASTFDEVVNHSTAPSSSSTLPRKSMKVTIDSASNAFQDPCFPNQKVKFSKKHVSFIQYLQNVDKSGSLGCPDKTFPNYKNGHYCCLNKISSLQERFDYVNLLLEAAITNVSDGVFNKYENIISILINYRTYFLRNKLLIDNFDKSLISEEESNYPSIVDDWFTATKQRVSNDISLEKKEPLDTEMMEDPRHLFQLAELAKNRAHNLSMTTMLKNRADRPKIKTLALLKKEKQLEVDSRRRFSEVARVTASKAQALAKEKQLEVDSRRRFSEVARVTASKAQALANMKDLTLSLKEQIADYKKDMATLLNSTTRDATTVREFWKIKGDIAQLEQELSSLKSFIARY